MSEINKISQKLRSEGWTQDQTPPGMKPWNKWNGGWEYQPQKRRDVVFEAPCGLLYKRDELSYSGHMSFMGVEWTEENDCITTICPYYGKKEPCLNNDPLLESMHVGCHDEKLHFCALHETDKPFCYEQSARRILDEAERLKEERWETFSQARGGRACKEQSRYNRSTGEWSTFYDPMRCTQMGCSYCKILGKELSKQRGNVFYDVRVDWTVKGGGLLPDEKRTSITKGIKFLKRPCSITLCEAIVKTCTEDMTQREAMRRHLDLFLGRIDSVEVFNIRAEIKEGRDLQQDLKDLADGIEIHHAADDLAVAAQTKRKRRDERKKQNRAKAEKLIRREGYRNLSTFDQRWVKKHLEPEEIRRIEQERAAQEADKAAGIGQNISLFEDGL